MKQKVKQEIRNQKQTHKLSNEQQRDIVIWSAEHNTMREIKAMMLEKHGMSISDWCIAHYKNMERWQPVIERYREEWERDMVSVPLAHKRKRLDELQKLYDIAYEKKHLERCQSIIRDFRDETEGKQFSGNNIFLTNITNNEFTSLTDEKLAEIKLKDISRLEQIRKMKQLGGSIETIDEESEGDSNE